ncbi:tetratricopeptide repeat protein [Pseudoalteromonas sp. McH1-42]|uniref:tetratricopeptide repeat protein n=1 Tax=Pseudoalteromonas sp. McH1-42 TaxID=2917752 RepID=UPI001EF6F532|nr:tetratricopeptide repeat protein [Pseudoalteromonas sp. McH1-42]MCG7561430.1 tetratricopeptide repeat protein [Pseudoalteromonas sp. McH1-42]
MDREASTVQVWALKGFLDELKRINDTMEDRRFVFILGAGASIQSGVKGAAPLAREWMQMLFHRVVSPETDFDSWLKLNPLEIDNWQPDNLAGHYPEIFARCFSGDHEAGFAELEKAIEAGSPSFGYAVLAWIMTKTSHNMVITTNFDNLVADSLYIYGRRSPHVIGHETLAGYLKPLARRPMVAKIHRDLFTDPINDPDGTGQLKKPWEDALKNIFKFYTPIFIGYGGNDGSLMNFLSDLSPRDISGRPFWCYYEPGGQPNGDIAALMQKHNGVLVPTPEWDQLMLDIGNLWGYKHDDQLNDLERYTEDMKQTLQEQVLNTSREGGEDIKAKLLPKPKQEQDKSWLDWTLEAENKSTLEEKLEHYLLAVKALPKSPELLNNYANALFDNGRIQEAERYYKDAITLDPDDCEYQYNYALLSEKAELFDIAEHHYLKALELNPQYISALNNYANLLSNHNRPDEAELYYKEAIALDPDDCTLYNNYADLLIQQKRLDEAEALLQKALDLVPGHPVFIETNAQLLFAQGKYQEALSTIERLLKLDPDSQGVKDIKAQIEQEIKRGKKGVSCRKK